MAAFGGGAQGSARERQDTAFQMLETGRQGPFITQEQSQGISVGFSVRGLDHPILLANCVVRNNCYLNVWGGFWFWMIGRVQTRNNTAEKGMKVKELDYRSSKREALRTAQGTTFEERPGSGLTWQVGAGKVRTRGQCLYWGSEKAHMQKVPGDFVGVFEHYWVTVRGGQGVICGWISLSH